MASTFTLSGTAAAIQPYTKYRPLVFSSNSVFEPLVSMANLILCTILGPPFGWRWNRFANLTSFTCNPGQTTPTDYPIGVPNFGWIEFCAAKDIDPNAPAAASNLWFQMETHEGLALATEAARPAHIAPQYDNGAGQITFRVMPAPDKAYPIQMDIQKKPVLFPESSAALSQTWGNGTVPDEYYHLVLWGMKSLAFLHADDPRFTLANQKFISLLLATHQGLSENQKNMFLGNWQSITGSQFSLLEKLKQGITARGT